MWFPLVQNESSRRGAFSVHEGLTFYFASHNPYTFQDKVFYYCCYWSILPLAEIRGETPEKLLWFCLLWFSPIFEVPSSLLLEHLFPEWKFNVCLVSRFLHWLCQVWNFTVLIFLLLFSFLENADAYICRLHMHIFNEHKSIMSINCKDVHRIPMICAEHRRKVNILWIIRYSLQILLLLDLSLDSLILLQPNLTSAKKVNIQ